MLYTSWCKHLKWPKPSWSLVISPQPLHLSKRVFIWSMIRNFLFLLSLNIKSTNLCTKHELKIQNVNCMSYRLIYWVQLLISIISECSSLQLDNNHQFDTPNYGYLDRLEELQLLPLKVNGKMIQFEKKLVKCRNKWSNTIIKIRGKTF